MSLQIKYIDKTITVPPVPPLNYNGVGYMFFEKMKEYKDDVIQIDGITGESDTYASLLQRCIRTAIAIGSRVITSEDVISICSFNHLNVHVPIIASTFLGVKFASLDPSMHIEDAILLLRQVQPKMVFVSTNAVDLIETSLQKIGSNAEIVVFGDTDNHTPFNDFLKESPGEEEFKPRKPESLKETFGIFFSSGTSGLPKGICWDHSMILGQIPLHVEYLKLKNTVSLSYASVYWISTFFFFAMAVAARGCRVILPNFDAKYMWTCVEKCKIGAIFITPNQVATLISEGRPKNDISSLKYVTTGGSCISREQVQQFQQFLPGVFVCVRYGQTEIGGALGFRLEDVDLVLQKPESCGRPFPGYFYKIVDPDTEKILGVNEKGELRIKTEYQMSGYYNMDSSSAFDSEGWFKTGDVAYYDEHFRFFILDRIKEMFKVRGVHVIPSKLEGIFRTHPAVENVVVFGVPHSVDDHHPTAVVTLKAGLKTTPEELKHFLDSKVSDSDKIRGGVKIVNVIPESPSGKVKRNYIRDLFVQGKI